jgi:hypothetical protein
MSEESGTFAERFNKKYSQAAKAAKTAVNVVEQSKKPAVKPPKPKRFRGVISNDNFADTTGQHEDALERYRQNLEGMSGGEMARRRSDAAAGIEGARASAARDLGRNQLASGVTGGIAFAQQKALADSAMQARAQQEQGIFLANEEMKRQALDKFSNFIGKERYGRMTNELSDRALTLQEQAALNQNRILDEYLKRTQNQVSDYGVPRPDGMVESLPNMLSSDRPVYEKFGDLAARSSLGVMTGGMSETPYGRELQEDIMNYLGPRMPGRSRG